MLGRPLKIDWHPADTPAALQTVYQAEGDNGLRTRLPVVACQAEAEALPFAAGSCDRVMANHMLYHVPHQEQALRELRHGKPPHQCLDFGDIKGIAKQNTIFVIACQSAASQISRGHDSQAFVKYIDFGMQTG